MGVKKLYNYLLRNRGGAPEKKTIDIGSEIGIDGSGLAHYLVKDDRNDLGGDYMRLEALVQMTLKDLIEEQKLKVTVYKDGKLRRSVKTRTMNQRLIERKNEWFALEEWANKDSFFSSSPTKKESTQQEENDIIPYSDGVASCQFPRPVLLMSVFYAAVVKYKDTLCDEEEEQSRLEIIECEEEADVILAKSAKYVLAEDSDFLVFKNCKYIPLHELEKLCNGEPVCIWTRRNTSRELHLPDEQRFIEFALLLGNDYVHRDDILKYLRQENITELEKIIKSPNLILEWLREHPNFCLSNDIPGVAFCRALYELESIDHFPFDQSSLLPINFEEKIFSPRDGSPTILPPDENDQDMNDLGLTRAGEFVLKTVHERLFLQTDIENKFDDSFLIKLLASADFQSEYASALAASLKILPHPMTKHRTLPLKPATFADVIAFFRYQKCIQIGFNRRDMNNIHFSALFDGPSFHAALEQQRSVLRDDDDDDDEEQNLEWKDEKDSEENRIVKNATVLPIDAHQDKILEHVARNRVTIIIGETGSGKSSRLPVMLLNANKKNRMFVSQPRRIAAKSLCERVRSQVSNGHEIGLRLGHGERDEYKETRVWFCTTGYLVRLIASSPQVLRRHTHLIIDEVHERSVDAEVICLLARRLIHSHPNLRLIVMSATLCTELLADYFCTVEPHVFVGARRFTNEIFYADDLVQRIGGFPRSVHALAQKLIRNTEPIERKNNKVTNSISAVQNDMVVALIDRIGNGDSSILVFVSGMSDIVELSDRILQLNPIIPRKQSRKFITLPIHSDVPYEEQARIFEKNTDAMTVRIILATNVAESSLTIPDLDFIIDLGVAKSIQYNADSHRQLLETTWISKSSATQRAGRTGRVRPGKVFRLYAYDRYLALPDHDISEIQRTPLDSIILHFYSMLEFSEELNDSVSSLLAETLEPPKKYAVAQAFNSLFTDGLLNKPSDEGIPTAMGTFVSTLGVDLSLGRLVGIGAQIGILDDAITLAAILSQSQSPWRIASPLVHNDPNEYNAIATTTFASRLYFDGGIRSEPIAIMRLLEKYAMIPNDKKRHFIHSNGLAASRLHQLVTHCHHLKMRVQAALNLQNGDDENLFLSKIQKKSNSYDIITDKRRLNRLRLLLTWTARDSIFKLDNIISSGTISEHNSTLCCKVQGPLLTPQHIDSLCVPVPITISGGMRTQYRANDVRPYLCHELAGGNYDHSNRAESKKKKKMH
uniref:Uncharacterized protein n=1 Tax=Aureoumbra lagunensis TaxID=44058 RepID=A0A7S3JYC1_9STRA